MLVNVAREHCPKTRATWNKESENADERRALEAVGALFSDFHVKAWYWQVFELLRKLILSSVISFVSPGSSTQVFCGVTLAYASLCASYVFSPYIGKRTTQVSSLGHHTLFLLFLCGAMVKMGVREEAGRVGEAAFDITVAMLTAGVFVIPTVCVIAGYLFDDMRGKEHA